MVSVAATTSDRTAAGSTIAKPRAIFAAFLTTVFLSCRCCTTLAAAHGPLFPTGAQYEYAYRSTVLAGDGHSGARGSGPVGHRVVGRLSVASLWSAAADPGEKLLRLHVSITFTLLKYNIKYVQDRI